MSNQMTIWEIVETKEEPQDKELLDWIRWKLLDGAYKIKGETYRQYKERTPKIKWIERDPITNKLKGEVISG